MKLHTMMEMYLKYDNMHINVIINAFIISQIKELRDKRNVFRLKKALYGLKQAPRAWYFKLDECFSSLGFKRSKHEHVVYFKKNDDSHLLIGVHVDDLIMTSANSTHFKGSKLK